MGKYKKIPITIITALTITLTLTLTSGCQTARRPKDKEPPQKVEENIKKPPIPEAISQGENKEPLLKVYLTEGERVDEMKFEDYLVGVLAGEMSNDFPEEALAAQAILARTFVMEFVTEKGQSKYEGAHVSTDIEEAQAWNAQEVNERIIEAVAKTRGQVMVHDNKYVKAWFHAHAGGQTASAKEGLGYEEEEPAYIKVVESPDSPQAPEEDSKWTASFSKAEISKAAEEIGQTIGDFDTIEIGERGPSGRASQLKIGDKTLPAPALRIALDSKKMKSTKLEDIRLEGDRVTMSGRGYGHGVGMSQWGAHKMAEEGKSAQEIIKHYFKDVEIVKLWE